MGHTDIRLIEDSKVCKLIAQKGYHVEDGARGIVNEVENVIEKAFYLYAGIEGLVDEKDNEKPMEEFYLKVVKTKGGGEEVRVHRKEREGEEVRRIKEEVQQTTGQTTTVLRPKMMEEPQNVSSTAAVTKGGLKCSRWAV